VNTNPRYPHAYQETLRYDGRGQPHYNKVTGQDVPTPHVHTSTAPGGVRPAAPGEIPGKPR
jgi:hypothetical protein